MILDGQLKRLRHFRSWLRRRRGTMDYSEYQACLEGQVSVVDTSAAVDGQVKEEEALEVPSLLEKVRSAARPKPPESGRVLLTTQELALYDSHVCGDGDPNEILASRFNVNIT